MKKTSLNSLLVVTMLLGFAMSACAKQEDAPPQQTAAPDKVPQAMQQSAAPSKDKVLATVGTVKITEESVFAPLAMMPPQFKSRYETPEGKKKLLERAVQMSLLSQEARKLGLDKKPEIAQRIKDMTDQLIVQELTKTEVVDKMTVNEQELKEYFDKNPDKFKKEERVRADLIMFAAKDSDTQQVKTQKKALADKTLARLKKGEPFETVAKEVSEDQRTKARGGNNGLFPRNVLKDQYGEAFEQKAFGTAVNQLSDVFKAKDGLYIIKVMEKKPAEVESFDEAKARIERTLKTEKQKTVMDNYLEELKKKYPVTIADESMK